MSGSYHSRFNPECNTERDCIDSLSVALGFSLLYNVYCFKVISYYKILSYKKQGLNERMSPILFNCKSHLQSLENTHNFQNIS